MAAAVMGADIDSFIRDQKAKLASERNALNDGDGGQTTGVATRRHWDRQAGREVPIAVEETRPRTQETGLPLNNSRSALKQRELAEQRNREYNELKRHGKGGGSRGGGGAAPMDDDEISNPSIIPFNRAQEDREKKRHMQEERQREYQQMKARLEENHRQGRSEASQRAPADQRRADRGSLLEQTDEYKAKLPGTNDSDLAKQIEREQRRNDEYNQHLRENDVGRRTRASDRDGDNEFFATLPGLRDSISAKARKEQQRNREYNEFLASRGSQRNDGKPPVAPRKGWGTPTYEDILDKKREEEAHYRRAHDSGYGQPLELDSRVRQSRDLDTKLLKSSRDTQDLMQEYREVLSRLQDNYNGKTREREAFEPPRRAPREVARNVTPSQPSRTRESPHEQPSDYYATLPIGSNGTSQPVPSRSQPGPLSTEEAKRRQKEQYRHELQKQMREVQEGRQREKQAQMNINYSGEKQQDMKVDYSGFKDPEERRGPVLQLSNDNRRPPPSRSVPQQQPYYSDGLDRLDQLNSRADLSRARQRTEEAADVRNPSRGLLGTPFSLSGGGGGVLDTGFSSLLEAPRHSSLAPPPGLEYQPASFITQGGGRGLGHTSVEDAYNFYASHNPLDNDAPVARAGGGGGGGGGGAGTRPLQSSQDRGYMGRGGGGGGVPLSDRGGGPRSRVRFEDDEPRRLATMDFPNDDDKKRESQKKVQAYQEELNRQIEEKKRKKMQDKEEKERYDRKLEQEAIDADGNIISDLRSRRHDGNNPDSSRRARPPPQSYASQFDPSVPSAAASVGGVGARDDLFGPPPVQTTADGEQSHARGGHGIFGLPKTSEEKVASEKYKDDLRRQIEERKLEELRRKEEERQEEEREQRRLDEQRDRMQQEYEQEQRKLKEKEEERDRMQQEYEQEQRKLKEKEEEARRKNEELVREAEERKRQVERKRNEAEDKRMEEERHQRDAEMNARLANVERGKSPVIPALRNKNQENGDTRVTSPPVPAARTRAAEDDPMPSTSKEEPAPVSRAASADVLNQLAVMRRQLQNERQRVEDMLQSEKKPPEVFDPRLMQHPPELLDPRLAQKPPAGKAVEVDVFETARLGNAVAVRRTPGDRANAQNAEDFSALKHKEDSDSRKEFRKLFPDRPSSGDALEAQQMALIAQQEKNLRSLREQRENGQSGYAKPSVPLRSPRGQPRTPQQLNSNSAFVDVDGLNYFPDDFDDMPSNRRNESARARRRTRLDSIPRVASRGAANPDPFGSSTSLNVDRLARKNEDRLKRLRELQGDDMSLYDPDDVLDRFMSKQSQNRPPSGQTLQDDSWLLTGPASKAGY
ncbi:hypothetical protein ACOMHN_037245 [Nucella lapillus]